MPRRCVRPATRAVHEATAGSSCCKRFLTKLLVCLHLRIFLNGNRTSNQERARCETRSSGLGERTSFGASWLTATTVFHALAPDELASCFQYRLALPIRTTDSPFLRRLIRLRNTHSSQRATGTSHWRPRVSASSKFALTFTVDYNFSHKYRPNSFARRHFVSKMLQNFHVHVVSVLWPHLSQIFREPKLFMYLCL